MKSGARKRESESLQIRGFEESDKEIQTRQGRRMRGLLCSKILQGLHR